MTNSIENNIPIPYCRNSVTVMTATADKYPQGYFKEKKCRFCKKTFLPVAPSHHYCSEQCAIQSASEAHLKRNYGITLKEYTFLYKKQEGKCAICKREGFSLKDTIETKLVVDHDHLSGKVRGLLCPNCNRALGLFKDSKEYLQNAIEYLQEPLIQSSYDYPERGLGNNKPLSEKEVFRIYDDIFVNKLRTKDIEEKYNISRNTKRNIELGKSYKSYLKKYRERATTIQ